MPMLVGLVRAGRRRVDRTKASRAASSAWAARRAATTPVGRRCTRRTLAMAGTRRRARAYRRRRRRSVRREEPPVTEALPKLRRPVLVAAFEGWNDAADAATDAVEHLEEVWEAQPLAAIDPDDYYDFQVNRPMVTLVNGVTR